MNVQLDRKQFEEAIVAAMSGTSRTELMQRCALSERDAKWLKKRVGMTSLEFQAAVLGELELVRGRLIEMLWDKADKITPNYLATAIGILTDKIHGLNPYRQVNEEAKQPKTQINIQMNGVPVDKNAILRELYGNVVDVVDAEETGFPDPTRPAAEQRSETLTNSTGLDRQDLDTESQGESDSTENKSTVPDA